MTSELATTAMPRRSLTRRQRTTVDSLLRAGQECLADRPIHDLSLRDIARHAGVTHTTAYTYFASKEHLIAELHRRLLAATPVPETDSAAPLSRRLTEMLAPTAAVFATDANLAEAVLTAMAASDPDTRRVRDEVGRDIARRIAIALGPDADPALVDGIVLCYAGAMLQAGLGYTSFDTAIERIAAFADRWPTRA